MKSKLILPSKRIDGLQKLDKFLKTSQFQGSRYFILADENTYTNCLPLLITEVEVLQEAEFMEVENGEQSKTLEIAKELWEALLESGADRNTILVNLGGGVISDLGGFIAAGFKRGIRYINIPTSLLGMVDAAIGGKTAINIGVLKNQVGVFHQPVACCIEPRFLDTLPANEILSGLGEVFKTALLLGKENWQEFLDSFSGENMFLKEDIIINCASFKKRITDKDFQEKNIRKILNFGHTLGHAIESYQIQKEKPIAHGHAVALGIIYEIYLSVKKFNFPKEDYDQINELIKKLFPVISYSQEDIPQLYELMKHDKKNSDEKIKCVLLQSIGEPVFDIEITYDEIFETICQCK